MRRSGWLTIAALVLAGVLAWSEYDSVRGFLAPDRLAQDQDGGERAPVREPPRLAARQRVRPGDAAPPDQAIGPEVEEGPTSYAIEGTARMADTDDAVSHGVVVAYVPVSRFVNGRMKRMRDTWRGNLAADGRFRIEVTGTPPRKIHGFAYEEDDLGVKTWAVVQPSPETTGETETRATIDAVPGDTYEVQVLLHPAFHLRGEVTDGAGTPLEDVTIQRSRFSPLDRRGFTYGERVMSAPDGRFDIGPFPSDGSGYLFIFRLDGFGVRRLDPWAVPQHERNSVKIVLRRAASLAGTLVDDAGTPLEHVIVEVEYADRLSPRRAARTDANGRWRLDNLQQGSALLRARAFAYGAKVHREIKIAGHNLSLELVAQAIVPPAADEVIDVLGLSLLNVDDALRQVYELPDRVSVVIVAVDESHKRLGIGTLEPGCGLFFVGDIRVGSIKDVVKGLLQYADPNRKEAGSGKMGRSRLLIGYTFADEDTWGMRTDHAHLTRDDLAALKLLDGRLATER